MYDMTYLYTTLTKNEIVEAKMLTRFIHMRDPIHVINNKKFHSMKSCYLDI